MSDDPKYVGVLRAASLPPDTVRATPAPQGAGKLRAIAPPKPPLTPSQRVAAAQRMELERADTPPRGTLIHEIEDIDSPKSIREAVKQLTEFVVESDRKTQRYRDQDKEWKRGVIDQLNDGGAVMRNQHTSIKSINNSIAGIEREISNLHAVDAHLALAQAARVAARRDEEDVDLRDLDSTKPSTLPPREKRWGKRVALWSGAIGGLLVSTALVLKAFGVL